MSGVFDVTHMTVLQVIANQSDGLNAYFDRLLDYGHHAPTTYFPLLVPECLLIEPTETESKETIDEFVAAMASILREVQRQPDLVASAPHTLLVKRLVDVKAARELHLSLTDY